MCCSSFNKHASPDHRALGASSYFHWSTLLAVTAQQLGLSEAAACELLGYTVARDLVSAAVRLPQKNSNNNNRSSRGKTHTTTFMFMVAFSVIHFECGW
jgi:urease accessory protein UreF